MSLTHVEPVLAPDHRRPRARAATWVAAVLLVCHAALLVAVLVTAEKQSSFGDLEEQVAAGDVRQVSLTPGLSQRSTGFATVEVHWRDGLVARVAQVVEVRRRGTAEADLPPSRRMGGEEVPVVGPSTVDRLRDLQPGLAVERVPLGSGVEMAVLDLKVSGWVAGLLGVALLATLFLLALGPETDRATPWAWFWLLISPAAPVSAVALLVLGGYLPVVPRPRPGARRLTGGWAFVIFLVLGSGLGWAA